MKVYHTLEPIYDKYSKVLILGSMPSMKSKEVGFYYGHPKNRFWSTLATIYEEKIDDCIESKIQFLKKHHVQELVEIVDSCEVPVLAYGLKNDFRNELFEGSYYMLVYADKIEEIKTICWCGRKATMVARVVNGKMVKQGEQVVIGGNDMYVSLCRKHYNDGRFSENK